MGFNIVCVLVYSPFLLYNHYHVRFLKYCKLQIPLYLHQVKSAKNAVLANFYLSFHRYLQIKNVCHSVFQLKTAVLSFGVFRIMTNEFINLVFNIYDIAKTL